MKKLLFLLFTCMLTTTMQGQGKWETTMNEADELKEQEAGEVMIYTVPKMGSFVIWGWDKYQFRLTSDEAQFNIETIYNQYTGSHSGVLVLVGIYEDNGTLKEKFKMWLDREDNVGNRFVRTRNAGGMANPVGQKGKVKKIFKALQANSGYVRIVVQRYNTTDFDIKITPYTK